MTAPALLPAPTWAQLAEEGGDREVTAEHDDQIPRIEPDAYGGHESVGRPGRRPLTPWRGPGQIALKFGLFLDANARPIAGPGGSGETLINKPGSRVGTATASGAAGGAADLARFYAGSVEFECRTLEELAGGLVKGDPEPPSLIVTGAMIPHSAQRSSGNRWLIAPQGIEWGDAIRRDSDGARVTQQVSLTLWLRTEDGGLARIDPAQQAPSYKVFVTTAKLNTYTKIAAHKLGSAKLAKRLAALNKVRDPNHVLAPGAQVRLPSAHTLTLWRRQYGIR